MSKSTDISTLPNFEWIDIDSEITVFDQQGSHQSGTGVKISQYLVTNRQYEAFVSAGGYQKDAFWGPHLQNEENLENGKRPAFARSQWPQPNRPKTDVNWYEAMAFCDWLNKEVEVSKPSNKHVFSLLADKNIKKYIRTVILRKEKASLISESEKIFFLVTVNSEVNLASSCP
jgi:hypothetical protein